MNRIVIVGNGGSGKSTLARRLGARLGLGGIHLDAHFWRAGWVAADTIVFLDFPRWRCLWQAMTRLLRYWGRSRPDLAPGCPEGFDWPFLKWIWRYPVDDRPTVLMQFDDRHAAGRTVAVLRSPREVHGWLAGMRAGRGDVAAVKSG